MSNLTLDDEALLERARHGFEATARDHARIKQKLFDQLGTVAESSSASGGASAGSIVATGAAAKSGAMTIVAKVVLAVAVAGGAVGAGAAIARGSRGPSNITPNSPLGVVSASAAKLETSPPSAEMEMTPVRVPEETALQSGQSMDNVAPHTPKPVNRDHPTSTGTFAAAAPTSKAPRGASPSLTPAPAPASIASAASANAGPSTVATETALLREADRAVKSGQPARALTLLNEHATRFANGILVEEREAERVAVLCALGRMREARDAALLFLRDRPRSPLVGRVRASCEGTLSATAP